MPFPPDLPFLLYERKGFLTPFPPLDLYLSWMTPFPPSLPLTPFSPRVTSNESRA